MSPHAPAVGMSISDNNKLVSSFIGEGGPQHRGFVTAVDPA